MATTYSQLPLTIQVMPAASAASLSTLLLGKLLVLLNDFVSKSVLIRCPAVSAGSDAKTAQLRDSVETYLIIRVIVT